MNLESLYSLKGKKVLVMGALNEHSLGFGIAQAAAAAGASVYLTYQVEGLQKRAEKLQAILNSPGIFPCDVTDDAALDALASWVAEFGPIDGIVHSIAYAPRGCLEGPYLRATGRTAFCEAMDVSVYSLTGVLQRLEPHLNDGASVVTLSFYASTQVFSNYNVMGVAKAALEASVRSLAVDFGPRGIRVNAISASPARTAAAAGIKNYQRVGGIASAMSPFSRLATLEEVGAVGAFLLGPGSTCFTGAVFPANCGVEITAHAPPWNAALMESEMGEVQKISYVPIGAVAPKPEGGDDAA